ncbi:MAG: flagellar basal body rod protein FlgB, partial [Candidatus Aquicultor sp.]
MLDQLFSNDTFVSLQKGLDASSLRQQVIANNVANINTPGYKKQDVSFEDEFKQAIDNKYDAGMYQTDPRHLPGGSSLTSVGIKVNTIGATSMRYDGNNVDIDEEMSKMAENAIRYNAMAQLMSGRLSSLKTVINGGR